MAWKTSYQKAVAGVSAWSCCAALLFGTVGISKAEAIDLGGAAGVVVIVIDTAVEHAYFNQQLTYFDGEGRDEYYDLLAAQEGVNEDPKLNGMLDNIMTRLSASIAKSDPSIKKKPYRYFVNNQTTFNAFCTIGNTLSVNTGLFSLLNNNEDEIALIVAHELGHGQKGHPIKGYQKVVPLSLLTKLYDARAESDARRMAASVIANYAAASSATKPEEWEADNLAFDYIVNAGYNPGAGAAVWQRIIERMGQSSNNFIGEIFSPTDHPKNQERRDHYANRLYEYSRRNVTAEDGTVKLRDKVLLKTTANGAMSGEERSYLVAGNLAAAFSKNTIVPDAYVQNGMVKIGRQEILYPNEDEPSAHEIVDMINKIK